jgi:hypothetical protein
MADHEQPLRPDRRRSLAWLAGAIGATQLPGLGHALASSAAGASAAAKHALPPLPRGPGYGTDPGLLKDWQAGEPWPLTLNARERAALAAIADRILPAEGTAPAASAVGVVDCLDEWLSAPYAGQQADRALVLPALEELLARASTQGSQFEALPADLQLQWLKTSPAFPRLRELVAGAYYSTPAGAQDLAFAGDSPSTFFAGPSAQVLRAAGYAPPTYLEGESGWLSLFDGRTLEGWRASDKPGTFSVDAGCILVNGPRSHLFYEGPVQGARFTDFDFEAEIKTRHGTNSGVYIHTQFQAVGWPERGYEVQVNNSQSDPSRTAGLYGIVDFEHVLVPDEQWFLMSIRVEGKRIQTWINGRRVVDYIEPAGVVRPPEYYGRLLGSGTFALQGHDPGSMTRYRNLRVRPLGKP